MSEFIVRLPVDQNMVFVQCAKRLKKKQILIKQKLIVNSPTPNKRPLPAHVLKLLDRPIPKGQLKRAERAKFFKLRAQYIGTSKKPPIKKEPRIKRKLTVKEINLVKKFNKKNKFKNRFKPRLKTHFSLKTLVMKFFTIAVYESKNVF